MTPQNYLPHIDGLRALAVIAVIVFHYDEHLLPGGYLGVDLFFVISGFVITRYLAKQQSQHTAHSLAVFYVRRFKRLIPALLFCLSVTAVAFLTLTTRPSIEIFQTATAAVFGMSNNYLFIRSADYFSLNALLNPYTHTWSLGVEEQFYLIYPGLLAILGITAGRRKEKLTIFVLPSIFVLSISAFLIFSQTHPTAAFYLLPFRFWEFMAGGVAFLYFNEWLTKPPKGGFATTISILSIGVVIACFFVPSDFQAITTPVMVLFSIPLLLNSREHSPLPKLFSSKSIVYIGLLSYSLYLWHWPMLLLAKSVIGTNAFALSFAAIATIVFSLISYKFVERPLRYANWGGYRTEGAVYISAMIVFALIFAFAAPKFSSSYNNLLAEAFQIPEVENWADDVDCHGVADLALKKNPIKACLSATRTDIKPRVVYLIGDSHAAQLYFMLDTALLNSNFQLKFINDGAIQALINGEKVIDQLSLKFILAESKPDDIVVLAFHRGRLNDSRDAHIDQTATVPRNKKMQRFKYEFSEFQSNLADRGVKILLVRDTPLMNTVATSPSCRLQLELFGESSCKVELGQDMHTRKRQDTVFSELLSEFPNTCVWDPLPHIYRGEDKHDVVDNESNYIMWDWNHITKRESLRLSAPFAASFQNCISGAVPSALQN